MWPVRSWMVNEGREGWGRQGKGAERTREGTESKQKRDENKEDNEMDIGKGDLENEEWKTS